MEKTDNAETFYQIEAFDKEWYNIFEEGIGLDKYRKYAIACSDALKLSQQYTKKIFRIVECTVRPRTGYRNGLLITDVRKLTGTPDTVMYKAEQYRGYRWEVLSTWSGQDSLKFALDYLHNESKVVADDALLRLVKSSSESSDAVIFGYQGRDILPAQLVRDPNRTPIYNIDGSIKRFL